MPENKPLTFRLVLMIGAAFTLSYAVVTQRLRADEAIVVDSATAPIDLEPLQDTTVVSDLSPEAIAREILMLQQQMGGSIVKPTTPTHWENPGGRNSRALITDQPTKPNWSPYPASHIATHVDQPKKIAELREVAFTLDTTAHRLEKLDLYQQADALRQVAQRLRQDARQVKQGGNAPAFHATPATNGLRDPSSLK